MAAWSEESCLDGSLQDTGVSTLLIKVRHLRFARPADDDLSSLHIQQAPGRYIPNKKVVGLSKLARTVDVFSKRLQTQERLTMQIASTLMKALDAKGVAVTIDAAHQCMTMRGIKKEKATTITNYFLGSFKDDLSYQNRYLTYIGN